MATQWPMGGMSGCNRPGFFFTEYNTCEDEI